MSYSLVVSWLQCCMASCGVFVRVQRVLYLCFYFLETHCCNSAGRRLALVLLILFLGPQQALEPVLDHLVSPRVEEQRSARETRDQAEL